MEEEEEDVSEWSSGSLSGIRGGSGSGLGMMGGEVGSVIGVEVDGVREDVDAVRGNSGN